MIKEYREIIYRKCIFANLFEKNSFSKPKYKNSLL